MEKRQSNQMQCPSLLWLCVLPISYTESSFNLSLLHLWKMLRGYVHIVQQNHQSIFFPPPLPVLPFPALIPLSLSPATSRRSIRPNSSSFLPTSPNLSLFKLSLSQLFSSLSPDSQHLDLCLSDISYSSLPGSFLFFSFAK